MKAFLEVMIPRLRPDVKSLVHAFQCKDDLLKNLPARLKGYSNWIPDNHRIVVLVDRDADDCRALKDQLETVARDAGLVTRSRAGKKPYDVVNRIVVEELEAWFFGDWEAVRTAYPRAPAGIVKKAGFRYPDAISGGTWESFERMLQKAGYFRSGLRKTEVARNIARHMCADRNRSHSFRIFLDAVRDL